MGHAPIAGVGPGVAGFLVAPERGDAELAAGALQHLLHRADPHHQGLAELGQGRTELLQAFGAEGPLARRNISLLPLQRLDHHQGQHRPPLAGLQQRLVIDHPQVPLEPDDL